jgi:RIO1 family
MRSGVTSTGSDLSITVVSLQSNYHTSDATAIILYISCSSRAYLLNADPRHITSHLTGSFFNRFSALFYVFPKVWAEKEMRNLRRLHAAGIPSPCPVMVKSNVLVMEFLGENGWPAPRYTIAYIMIVC